MNHKASVMLIQNTWLSWMQHRSFFFILAFGWMIPPLIYLFVWSTAAAEHAVGGFTKEEFYAYYLILIFVNQLTFSSANWTVGDVIREGSLSRQLLQPIAPIYHALAHEISSKVVLMAFVFPVTAVLAVFLRPKLPESNFQSFLLSLAALTLACLLRFFWGYWLALLAFWITRADSLLALQDAMIFILAGQVAPTILLPGIIQKIALVLPFRYMVGFPVEIITGKLISAQILMGFAIQGFWLLVSIFLYIAIWKNGLKRYTAIGG